MSVENISLFHSVLDEALERLGKKNLKLKPEGVSIGSGKGCCCRPERHDLYLAYWLWKVTYIPASSLLRLIESFYLQRMPSMGDIQFFVCRSRIIPEPPFPSQGIAGSGNEIDA